MVLARLSVPLADARLQRARSAPRPMVPPRRAMPASDFNYASVNLRPCEVSMYASVFTVCSLFPVVSARQAVAGSSAAKRWLCRGDGSRKEGGRGDLIRARRNLASIGLD